MFHFIRNFIGFKSSSYTSLKNSYIIPRSALLIILLFYRLSKAAAPLGLLDFFVMQHYGGTNLGGYVFEERIRGFRVGLWSYGRHLPSTVFLFDALRWLEREGGEMVSISFLSSSDTRNLLMPYGDRTYPLQKFVPSIGVRDYFYSVGDDQLRTRGVTVQY